MYYIHEYFTLVHKCVVRVLYMCCTCVVHMCKHMRGIKGNRPDFNGAPCAIFVHPATLVGLMFV
jgi:hypothetical protein